MTPPDKKLERLYQRLAALRKLDSAEAIVELSRQIRLEKQKTASL